MLARRDRSFRNWSVYQDRGPRWVGPHGQALASVGQQALALAQGGESRFDYPAAAKIPKTATDSLELSGMTMYQTRHSGASIDRVRGFRILREVQKRGRWRAFSSVARYGKGSHLAADYHSLPLTLRNKLETLARRAEGLLTGRLRIHQLTSG